MVYLFSLGRAFPLCLAELKSLLRVSKVEYKIQFSDASHVVLETEKGIDTEKLLKKSGGIIKIGKILTNPAYAKASAGTVLSNTNKLIESVDLKKYKNFGVSLIGFKENIQKICEELKKEIRLHYVLPKDGTELSSSQISEGKTLEIVIVKNGEEFQVFETIAVQDINFWTKKDAGRPHVDDKLGMLPLKVARMMVNLTIGEVEGREGIEKIKILDPFCGMGSILQEAVDLGINNIVGSDINADVLKRCEENLNWFISAFSFQHVNMTMINSDAAKIDEKMKEKVDLIVTEPFLGDAHKLKRIYESTNLRINESRSEKSVKSVPRESSSLIRGNQGDTNSKQTPANVAIEIKKILKGLEKMYLGSLKAWKNVLEKGGSVCMIVPEIEVGGHVFTLPFVEITKKTGYNIVSCYEYSREKAVVRRKIYILKIRNSNIEIRNKLK